MQEDAHKVVKDTAMETLFPHRGDTPCPLPTAALAGTYRDAGYGTLVFAAVPHPDSDSARRGETILEAARHDAFVPVRARPVPVTRLHWLAYMMPIDEDKEALSLTMRTEFNVGIDAEVEALEIDFTNPVLGIEDGKVLFKKIRG